MVEREAYVIIKKLKLNFFIRIEIIINVSKDDHIWLRINVKLNPIVLV